jgi:DNA-directed RNA polymerase II subunit RPB2
MYIKDSQTIFGYGGAGAITTTTKSSDKEYDYNLRDMYKLIDLYFTQKNIMYNHLIYSYDRLIGEDIPNFLKNPDNHYFFEYHDEGTKIYRYKFEYTDISVRPPINEKTGEYISPSEARLKNLTFKLSYLCTVTQKQEILDITTGSIETRTLGQPDYLYPVLGIPVMLGTEYDTCNINKDFELKECRFDPKGYFIINGQEKNLIPVERLVDNKPLVFKKKESNADIFTVQINSRSFTTDIRQIINIILKKESILTIKVPILNEVPVIFLIRALGIESDRDILDCIITDHNDIDMMNLVRVVLEGSKQESNNKIYTQEEALTYLSNKIRITRRFKYTEDNQEIKNMEKKTELLHLFHTKLLPHMDDRTLVDKAKMFCVMINRLLQCFLGRIEPDDRDSFQNKRIDAPEQLLFDLFKQNYKKMLSECSKYFRKRNTSHVTPQIIINQIKANVIEQGFKNALARGTFDKKDGVSQMLPRMSYNQTIAALRRINSPSSSASTSKLTGPRLLHASQIGFLCFVETPEGHKVGMIKNFSLIGSLTVMLPNEINNLRNILRTRIISISDVSNKKLGKYVKVYLNGEWVGLTKKPRELVKELRDMKLRKKIDMYTGISYEIRSEIEYDIRINCDSGRLIRPILRVDENNNLYLKKEHLEDIDKKMSWNDFLMKYPDVVEYIDVDEQSNSLISMFPSELAKHRAIMNKDPVATNVNGIVLNRYDENVFNKYNYCEIHPSLLLGAVVTNIPFCNHNQGPRNIFQYSQAKHAMGIYATNYRDRFDSSYILYHPSKPLITSRNIKYTNTDQIPAGENAVVAIMCYSGYNQEDSVMINQSAIDRGFFRSMTLKKHSSEIRKNQETSKEDMFTKPDPAEVSGMKYTTYDKLNELGYAPEETHIVTGDIIIGKISSIQQSSEYGKKYKDASEAHKSLVPGVINKVATKIYNAEDYEMTRISVRSERRPHIGDKVCLTDEHEVLTTLGWIPIKNVTKNHLVAVLEDGVRLNYVNPLDIIHLNYEGKLYQVKSDKVDLTVTLDHQMYVKFEGKEYFELINAKDIIGKKVSYKKDAMYNNKDQGYICNKQRNKEIKNIIKQKDTTNDDLTLPSWIWSVPQSHAQVYVHAILAKYGQGTMYTFEYHFEFNTKNKRLVDDIQRLCLHAGYISHVDQNEETYCVTLLDYTDFNPKCTVFDPYVYSNEQTETLIDYKGPVYCLEVPTHVFMVRKNFKPVWTGNCSRHGQKGTIGITYRQANMPFTKDGISPDIIVNPNAIPSRMTIGQLIECLIGKVSALRCHETDGTPFQDWDIERIKDILEELGYNREGEEYLYNGMTGKRLESTIFIGPTYYQRLKHMVSDKIHSRSTGAVTILTRQAPEGRSRDGGLRFGEMERDCVIAHGLAQFLKERMLETADQYYTTICDNCGFFAQRVKNRNSLPYVTSRDTFMCPNCKNSTDISKICIPYACKILFQELMGMNIAIKIRVKNSKFTS